jgi:hypothetical protein
MRIVPTDPPARRVPPGTDPDYNSRNPLGRVIDLFAACRLACEREHYAHDLLQVLLPIESLTLYGPRTPNEDVLEVAAQDFVDFQKQNVQDFTLGDMHLIRGWASLDAWSGPFLRLSYRGGPDSRLSQTSGHTLGPRVRLFLKVNDVAAAEPLVVPYNPESDRYEIELWSYAGADLRDQLDEKGRAALDRGELAARPDLVQGSADAFRRDAIEDRAMPTVAAQHAMHPVRPLRVELAWADTTLTHWDSRGGANYVYEFSMIVRGWDHFLKVGGSSNPHGGVGRLEYRNLLSNYFEFSTSGELGRDVEPWSFDAMHVKPAATRKEPFLAVDYMDLHIVRPNGGIGLHRHRDNQELFMVLENEALMVVGDWCELPTRQRAFEVRTLRAGHFALLKPGQLHGLLNPTDEDIPLLMFGGYD